MQSISLYKLTKIKNKTAFGSTIRLNKCYLVFKSKLARLVMDVLRTIKVEPIVGRITICIAGCHISGMP